MVIRIADQIPKQNDRQALCKSKVALCREAGLPPILGDFLGGRALSGGANLESRMAHDSAEIKEPQQLFKNPAGDRRFGAQIGPQT